MLNQDSWTNMGATERSFRQNYDEREREIFKVVQKYNL